MTFLWTDVLLWIGLPAAFAAALFFARWMFTETEAWSWPDDATEKSVLAVVLLPFIAAFLVVPLVSTMPIAMTPVSIPDEVALPGAQQADERGFVVPLPSWSQAMAALLWAYGAVAIARLCVLLFSLGRLERNAQCADGSHWGGDVRVSSDASTPLATLSSIVLLPRALIDAMTEQELRMVIAHERAHLSRRDPLYFFVLALIDVLFWGYPPIRMQTRRCRLAAEIACDAVACAGEAQDRKAFASLIIKALQHASGQPVPHAPAVFSPRSQGEFTMRLEHVIKPQRQPKRLSQRMLICLAAGALLPLASLQWAMAESAASVAFTFNPVPWGKITSTFGEGRDPFSNGTRQHNGVDIGAPLGTVIIAPASGVVSRVRPSDQGFGNLLEITHADGVVTRYGQLERFLVEMGDDVEAGQNIATVGSSGQSTGPHLHLEIYVDGELRDPADHIPLPAKTSSR